MYDYILPQIWLRCKENRSDSASAIFSFGFNLLGRLQLTDQKFLEVIKYSLLKDKKQHKKTILILTTNTSEIYNH